MTTRHSLQIPGELSPRNTHNRSLNAIQAILGQSCKERLKGFTVYHILATLEQRISFSFSNTPEFLRLLFSLSGRSEAASAKAQLGAFRDEPMYQVVCCIPAFHPVHIDFPSNILRSQSRVTFVSFRGLFAAPSLYPQVYCFCTFESAILFTSRNILSEVIIPSFKRIESNRINSILGHLAANYLRSPIAVYRLLQP